jgi:hypothetical protein
MFARILTTAAGLNHIADIATYNSKQNIFSGTYMLVHTHTQFINFGHTHTHTS